MTTPQSTTWALWHIDCGEIAFRFVERPVRGQPPQSRNVRMPDGTTPAPGSEILCGACGKHVQDSNLRDDFLREEVAK